MIISVTPMRLLKKQVFEKKAKLSGKVKLWRNFLRSIEYDKCQKTTYKGTQGILTGIVPAI